MSLFPLLFWKDQLCHVYGEVQSVVYNTECDVLTAQERSGRAPTTGSANPTVPCATALIHSSPWSGRSSHPHLVKSYSVREKAGVHLSCASVWILQIPPQSLNAGSDPKSPAVDLLPWSSGLYQKNKVYSTKIVHSVRISYTMYGFILFKHRSCRSLNLMVFESCAGLFYYEEPADPQTTTKGWLASSILYIQ